MYLKLTLEKFVKEGKTEHLVNTIEATTVKCSAKKDKITTLSTIAIAVGTKAMSADYEERVACAAVQMLTELGEEDWMNVSAREAKIFKKVMYYTTMPLWVRKLLNGLLSKAEENDIEAKEEAAKQDNMLEKVSRKLGNIVNKILVNPPILMEKVPWKLVRLRSI